MKTIIITGGNTGIGFNTAKQIALAGHRVILACRNAEKAQDAIKAIKAEKSDAEVLNYSLDLSSFKSIKQFAENVSADFPKIDVLINNAGVVPTKQQFTIEGFETQIGVNYLGHFLLTHLLIPNLKAAGKARIVHLSSMMNYPGKINFSTFKGWPKYSGFKAYCQSKLANLMFSNELAKRLPKEITSNAMHPGGVDSDIYRDLPKAVYAILRLFLISTERPGKFIRDMAVGDQWEGRTGEFKSAHGPLPVSKLSKDPALSTKLYEESLKLTGVEAL